MIAIRTEIGKWPQRDPDAELFGIQLVSGRAAGDVTGNALLLSART